MIKSKKCPSYRKWRMAVLTRDNFTCQDCGITKDQYDREFHAHHIKKWKDFFELRIEVSNGITLCHKCHHKLHMTERIRKPVTEETREKMRLAKLGKPSPKKGKKTGHTPWNKGIKTGIAAWKGKRFSEEHKKNMLQSHEEFRKSDKFKEVMAPVWENNKARFLTDNPCKYTKGKTWIIDKETGKRKWVSKGEFYDPE